MSDSNTDINAELFNAVKNGEIDKVKSLISDRADVNASDGWFIPLYWAAKNHHFNIVEVLLDNGANIGGPLTYARDRDVLNQLEKKQAEYCKASLHLAARLGELEEVKNLLRKGAEIDAKNDKGQTPFDLAVDEEIKDLLQSVKEANDKLLEAAKSGNIGDIENLLNEEGKAQVNATDQDGKTPLHWAAENGHKDVVEFLLSKKADVNAVNKYEWTPLHWAALSGKEKVVEVLLKVKEINVNATDQYGGTPLHLAAEKGHKDVVEFLLNKEADVNATDQYGRTPLHFAALYGKEEVAALLLNKEANVNAKDQYGRTPLHWVAEKGHKDVVEFLLNKEADVNATDQDGNTPLDLTTNDEIIALLNKAAEDPDAGSVDEPSTDSKEDQEEDAGTEKKEGDAKSESDIAEKGTGVSNDSQPTGPTQNNGGQPTTSAGQGADVQNKGVNPVASTEPAQTEEQPSSFFGSLFSILMKPFSLIASFFGGFFYGCLGLTKKKLMNRSHSLMMMFLYLHRVHWTMIFTIQ